MGKLYGENQMFETMTQSDFENLTINSFKKTAVYFESMDYIDYVRHDDITVSKRVDQYLTLILNNTSTNIVGFRLKGIKNFFLRTLQPALNLTDDDFVSVKEIFVALVQFLGDEMNDPDIRTAYSSAASIASEDDVQVTLPMAA